MKLKLFERMTSAACLVAIAALGLQVQNVHGQSRAIDNPYSPAHGHPYRHGAVPTRPAWQKMNEWRVAHPASGAVAPAASGGIMSFQGGTNGIGVVSGTPKVYVVFWGSQWVNGGDPKGAATYLQHLYAGIGTGGETWSGTMTQYCDGPQVARGASSCPSGGQLVGYPRSGALTSVWFDDSAAVPTNASQAQIAAEAVAAAAHFGNTSAASNRYAQYVIAFPSGANPDGFPNAGYCAWHGYATSSYGDVAYTNLPYQTDAGSNCGENYVNSGILGVLDGFSIVGGHEYAETLTDELPTGGWCDSALGCSSHEDGDECAWIAPGQQGGAANVSMGNGAYAMQSTWSNDTDGCNISHEIRTSLPAPSLNTPIPEGKIGIAVQYKAGWTSVPNATYYEVWHEPNGYSSFVYDLTTNATSIQVGLPPGTWVYLEVQACNSNGCGYFSSQEELLY